MSEEESELSQRLPRATAALKRHRRVFDEALAQAQQSTLGTTRPEDLALLIYATGDEESRKAVTSYLRDGVSPFEGMEEEEVKDFDRKLAQQIVLAAI